MHASHFSLENIPFGIASSQNHPKKTVVTRLEDNVIFLDELATLSSHPFSGETIRTFSKDTVNDFAALQKAEQSATRKWLQSTLSKDLGNLPASCICQISTATLHLPLSVGDFTDFSCSRDHVLNAGEAVFGKRELPPGFEHFPVGYHGRTSSVIVSGTSIVRPKGQYRDANGKVVFGATKRLDYEIEVAAVIGKPSQLGKPVAIGDADDHIFGLVLLNDWSGKDTLP
jgi:fumarylacetoacetase